MPRSRSTLVPIAVSAALLFVAWAGSIAVSAENKAPEDVDHVALAALLIRDGHYDRAASVLEQVDETRKDVDLARLYTLRGLVGIHTKDLTGAKAAFERAVKEGQRDPIIHVYLAQVQYGLRDFRAALNEIEAAGEAGSALPEIHLMRSQAYWELNDKAASWRALEAGARRFPDNGAFPRRQIFMLIELGVYQEAAEIGRAYLNRAGIAKPGDALAIGNALRRSAQPREAAQFLERARLQRGASREVALELAHAYLDMGWTHTAAGVLEAAADQHPDLIAEAAELHRRAGRPYYALTLNVGVEDQKKKFKQRLALLMELERFDQVTTMTDSLHRVGLLDDDDIRYAVAYAHYRAGRYDLAEVHLAKVSRPDLFRKASEIRKAMDECRHASWKCD
jgi:thioredoxin-like negative regulator of GroEL